MSYEDMNGDADTQRSENAAESENTAVNETEAGQENMDASDSKSENPDKDGKNVKSSKYIWIGVAIGGGAVFLIAGITVLIMLLNFRQILGSGEKNTADTSGDVALAEEVLDSDTVEKLEAILKEFNRDSIVELDTEALQRGLIDGLVAGSGDKYAEYYDQDEIADLMGDFSGSFYGIGATLSLNEGGYAEVQSVYKGSPAEKGGMRMSDIIVKVDGTDVSGMSLDDIVAMIRGDKGTDVVVTVYRDGESDYLDLTLTRDEIEIVVVEYEMKENNIGYIHIEQWYDTTSQQFAEALADLKSQGMKGLIVDLRSNTGGLLSSVVSVCNQLLPAGTIVYTEDNKGRKEIYSSDGKSEIDIPVAILTNGYTASASEIFTGAMKDYGKAVSIGTNTYGKGVVQSFKYFSDGTAMKLTISQYFTPNGTAIDGVGIAPDIEVEFDSEAYYDEENPFDNQLDAAIQYLKEKM